MSSLITASMAAARVGVTADYIRHLIVHGKIKAEKIGRQWMIDPKCLRHFERKRSPRGTRKTTKG